MQRRYWLLLAFTFVLLDITLLANEIATRMPKPFFSPPDVVASFEPDHRAYAVMHRGDWSDDPNNHQLRGAFGPWFARNGLEPFTPASWGLRSALELDFDETALLPTHDLLDAMMSLGNSGYARWAESFAAISNVRYLIDYRPLRQVLSEQRPAAESRIVRLTHLASTGRYYFAQQIVEARSPADVVAFAEERADSVGEIRSRLSHRGLKPAATQRHRRACSASTNTPTARRSTSNARTRLC